MPDFYPCKSGLFLYSNQICMTIFLDKDQCSMYVAEEEFQQEKKMWELVDGLKQVDQYRDSDIYPAIKADTETPTIVVIIQDRDYQHGILETKSIDGIDISIFNYGITNESPTQLTDHHSDMSNSSLSDIGLQNATERMDLRSGDDFDNPQDDIEQVDDIINQHCTFLYFLHSNLQSIESSRFISKDKENALTPKICIVLLCKLKGYIPFGEEKFPNRIMGIPTDIREGLVMPTGCDDLNDPLGMGCRIAKKGFQNWCSVGMFTKHSDGTIGFISTAHGFIKNDQRVIDSALLTAEGRIANTHEISVVQPPNPDTNLHDETNVCGHIGTGCGWLGSIDIDSPLHGRASIGIDLVLVRLTKRCPKQSLTTPVMDDKEKNLVGKIIYFSFCYFKCNWTEALLCSRVVRRPSVSRPSVRPSVVNVHILLI